MIQSYRYGRLFAGQLQDTVNIYRAQARRASSAAGVPAGGRRVIRYADRGARRHASASRGDPCAAEGFTARLTAGFCWPWSQKPNPDGTLVEDVVIGNFRRPWNARPEATKLAAGIPKAPLWATDPGGIEQIGCVYTAQGFEFDYAGVIFGRDLRYDFDAQAWRGYPAESHDNPVKRAKDGFTDLVKNTYRVLLSRGLKGCYVYFVDKDTERFFRSRMDTAAPFAEAGEFERLVAEEPSTDYEAQGE